MNMNCKYLIAMLCSLAAGNSLYAAANQSLTELLTNYSMTAEKYGKKREKTETRLYTGLASFAAVATTAFGVKYGNMNVPSALLTAIPVGGSAIGIARVYFSGLVKRFARWLNSDRLFFFKGVRSDKKRLGTTAVTHKDFDRNKLAAKIEYQSNPYIRHLLSKAPRQTLADPAKSIPACDNIAGNFEREILETIVHLTAPEQAEALGLSKPHGILLHGPSGTGKTLKAKQIAALANVAWDDTMVGSLKNMWHGESEKNVVALFDSARNKKDALETLPQEKKDELARKQQEMATHAIIRLSILNKLELADSTNDCSLHNEANQLQADYNESIEQNDKPRLLRLAHMDPEQVPVYHPACILFIDEIDAFGSRAESHNGSDVSNGMITQLLGQMDGADKEKNKDIIVVGTTNRRELLDPAILRPGRFDKDVYIGNPRTAEERLPYIQFFGGHEGSDLGKYNVALHVQERYQDIANQTNNFSPAELDNLFKKAGEYAMVDGSPSITWLHMQQALAYMRTKIRNHQQPEDMPAPNYDAPEQPIDLDAVVAGLGTAPQPPVASHTT